MVGGQQLERNDAFGLRFSAYLGVFVCRVILGHVAEWSDGEPDDV
jgi:hypothetical protein